MGKIPVFGMVMCILSCDIASRECFGIKVALFAIHA